MARILISDSTSYLPENLINDYGIIIIPLNLHLEGKSYKEGRDISHADFYHIFESANVSYYLPAICRRISGGISVSGS